MKKSHMNRSIAVGITALLFFSSCVSGVITSFQSTLTDTIEQQNHEAHTSASITCYVNGVPQSQRISYESAFFLKDLFSQLAVANAHDSFSSETQFLQQQILTFAEQQNLLPDGLSPDTFLAELNQRSQINAMINGDANPLGIGRELFCNFVTTGEGAAFPIIILPRFIPIIMAPIPRLFVGWKTSLGITSCGGLVSQTGFIASGAQQGIALGFWGIGFSIFLPPVNSYGMFGYALFARVSADYMDFYPPNHEPEVSEVNPLNRAINVPVSLSELQFQIQDDDGDLMRYTVTTDPDIGSDSGNLKTSGIYSVPVNGLKNNSLYTWTVEVFDGKDTTTKRFSFKTPEVPFDPYDEGWLYRKQITVDHSQVSGTLHDFAVLINIKDADVSAKAQHDGDDILFMDGAGVAHKLYHEIESYESTTGSLVAWVRLPLLSSEDDTVFYMYYGNSGSGNQQNAIDTWDSHLLSVWHLKESSGEIHDSSEQITGGTINGASSVPGKIGAGLELVDHDIISGISSSYDDSITTALTLTTWVKWYGPHSYCPQSHIFDGRVDLGDHYFYLTLNHSTGTLCFKLIRSGSTAESSSQIPHDGTWTFIAAVFNDSSDTMRIFINGVEDTMLSTSDQYHNSNGQVFVGNNRWASGDGQWAPLNGILDELRLANTERSADWLHTEYTNQNDPASFLTIGPEE